MKDANGYLFVSAVALGAATYTFTAAWTVRYAASLVLAILPPG